MSLVSSEELLYKAQKEGFAIGAFNVENMEMIKAIIEAAEELSAPIIIQTTPSTIKYASCEMFKAIVYEEAKNINIPVALHLDHGNSFELCQEAIRSGYTSVMIDGSKLEFEKNIEISKKVVEVAHMNHIQVEAELGTVGGKEDNLEVQDKDSMYTNPYQAKDFVERTGIDSLAVAIGTAHGFYKGEPKLDFERLKEIKEIVHIPLVLHGASGVPDSVVQRAIEMGICKVNFATELRVAYTNGVKQAFNENYSVFDPKTYGKYAQKEVKNLVMHKLKVCKSENKA